MLGLLAIKEKENEQERKYFIVREMVLPIV